MKLRPDLASGPWPCYVVDFDELAAICTAAGCPVSENGEPMTPKLEAIDRVLEVLAEGGN